MSDQQEITPKNDWKSKRYWICQTGGMPLWIGLHSFALMTGYDGTPEEQREYYKNAVKSFPCEVSNCRCESCRYFRLTKNSK